MHDTTVTFDPAAFRAWLDTAEGKTAAETASHLSTGYDNFNGEPGWLASTVLLEVKDAPGAWTTATDTEVRAHVLSDAEGGDAGIVLDVRVGDQWLSAGPLTGRDLVPIADDEVLPGYEAAIIALHMIEAAVNDRVATYRASDVRGPIARQLRPDAVESALVTLRDLYGCPDKDELSEMQRHLALLVSTLVSNTELSS